MQRLLFISNDMRLARRLKIAAAKSNVALCHREALSDLLSVGKLAEFDGVIADSSSYPVSGIEIAEYAAALFPDLAVVLVGNMVEEFGKQRLPPSIKAYHTYSDSPQAMIESAVSFEEYRSNHGGHFGDKYFRSANFA